MDFHYANILENIMYPIKTVYSKESRKIRRVLKDSQPDVFHLNNFNYQLTPSVILEIVTWRKQAGKRCKIIFTAHDYQLICPNHMMNNPITHVNCEKCIGGRFINCVKGKCIHGSSAKSFVGMAEALFWNMKDTYKYFYKIICCSRFMKSKMDTNPLLKNKTLVMHNFIETPEKKIVSKEDYIVYFGRFSREKGVSTLIEAAKRLPNIQFVFAGNGDYS